MHIDVLELVVKLSASDVERSADFYRRIFGVLLDSKYTITAEKQPGQVPWVQLNAMRDGRRQFAIGLYEDISGPFVPTPQVGTVPSFIVPDIHATLTAFRHAGVTLDDNGKIYSNTSDAGYTDEFFFFRDPDNNSLVIRQNVGMTPHR